jgi:hypothetical protein
LANQGIYIAFMELGNDTFTWNPGDGSDVIEGQGGTDALIFNGSNISGTSTLLRTTSWCVSRATSPAWC